MLLMIGKTIRGWIFWYAKTMCICWYPNANNKYMKDYDKNKESSYLKYWDVNSSYGWAMSQKLVVKKFKLLKYISKFDKNFIKSYNEESVYYYYYYYLFI